MFRPAALLRALPAACAVATLAACADAPTAPTPPAAGPQREMSGFKPLPLPQGTAHMVDHLGRDVPGASVRFVLNYPSNTAVKVVRDNEPGDLDSRWSHVRAELPAGAGEWWAFAHEAPMPWSIHTHYKHFAVGQPAPKGFAFGDLTLRAKASVRVSMRTMQKAPALGATVRLVGGPVSWTTDQTLTDGREPLWEGVRVPGTPGAADGLLTFYVPASSGSGTYQVCEVAPPLGFLLPSPSCQSVTFDPQTVQNVDVLFLHESAAGAALATK
jgi:hypothetical protein